MYHLVPRQYTVIQGGTRQYKVVEGCKVMLYGGTRRYKICSEQYIQVHTGNYWDDVEQYIQVHSCTCRDVLILFAEPGYAFLDVKNGESVAELCSKLACP